MKIDHCRSCKAEIVWAITERGKRMPVDKEPSTKGNIMLVWRTNDEPPLAVYLTTEQIAAFDGSLQRHRLHLSHFVTCKEAAQWRKKR
jgi:hypothetical protein